MTMTTTETARQMVERILADNPRQSAAEIARQAGGISRQRVQQILKDSGYELVVYWRKKKT